MQVFALYCLLKIGAINCPIKEILYFTYLQAIRILVLLTKWFNYLICLFGNMRGYDVGLSAFKQNAIRHVKNEL